MKRHVPADHLLRSIDRFVDLSGLREQLRPFYSETGRPSIDPELIIRMLLVGYCFGIRSERRLCEEVHLNLAYRWFCGLGLDGAVPDHSTFSKNRHGRFRDSDLLRRLFETTVKRCIDEGLVGGDGFAVDASLIRAEANRQRVHPGEQGLPSAWRAGLSTSTSPSSTTPPSAPRHRSCPRACRRPTRPRAIRRRMAGKRSSATPPTTSSTWQNAVIVDVEASTAVRQAELTAAKRMIERAQDDLGLWPGKLVADTGYGSAEKLAWLVHERGIEPHIPVFEKLPP